MSISSLVLRYNANSLGKNFVMISLDLDRQTYKTPRRHIMEECLLAKFDGFRFVELYFTILYGIQLAAATKTTTTTISGQKIGKYFGIELLLVCRKTHQRKLVQIAKSGCINDVHRVHRTSAYALNDWRAWFLALWYWSIISIGIYAYAVENHLFNAIQWIVFACFVTLHLCFNILDNYNI